MLSVIRTPIRHLQTTISVLALILVGLIVFVVQRVSASETPSPAEIVVAAVPVAVESSAPLARQQKAGPQGKGRTLPWVRWEYIP